MHSKSGSCNHGVRIDRGERQNTRLSCHHCMKGEPPPPTDDDLRQLNVTLWESEVDFTLVSPCGASFDRLPRDDSIGSAGRWRGAITIRADRRTLSSAALRNQAVPAPEGGGLVAGVHTCSPAAASSVAGSPADATPENRQHRLVNAAAVISGWEVPKATSVDREYAGLVDLGATHRGWNAVTSRNCGIRCAKTIGPPAKPRPSAVT